MKVGIGQDSHRFDFENSKKLLVLGGVAVPNCTPLSGNSDADVVLHAITNAISGITTVNILGEVSDKFCLEDGIKASSFYLHEALRYLGDRKVVHVSISIECKIPRITPIIPAMRKNIAYILNIAESDVGITATSGERLTDVGKGLGIQAFAIVTAM